VRSVLLAILTSAVVACSGREAGGSTSDTPARVGQPAPAWSEPEVPKGTLSLASLRGKAIYLNFFATWCPPCNEEAPTIDRLQRRFGSQGLQVVGVDVLENAGKAESFRAQHHLSYPAIVDDGALRDQYNVNGLPVHVFIDREGVVRRIDVGELSAAEMREAVRELLREGPHPSAAY
jgi:cytochrome c biogenesis protein CcmG, thiol:disulfide interchange protein DsbE